ncbi:tetratricopeptide repeat protein [Symbioplanes lichenis]|uniref:tetratricopeptide repeat protein n=1 Tax=Symbioplanes lichenis TaxID=1629072 RepID=UPI0027388B8A|nr:tetratricopeptide repeat protein [Actinoplanes lichenis]
MPSYPQTRQQADHLAAAGDVSGARALLEQAVEQGRPGLAAGDPELLATMRQLAGLHSRAGDPAGARRLLEEAQAAGHRLGPADPLMVLLASDLAEVADELGNRHEARRNLALVAEHGPAALGPDHPAVIRARQSPAPSTSPASGPPISGPPTFAAPPPPVLGSPSSSGGSARGSRTPWIVAAAAVVAAVVMLVVVLVRPDSQPSAAPPAATPALPLGPLPLPSMTRPAPANTSSPASAPASPSAAARSSTLKSVPATSPAARPKTTSTRPMVTRIATPASGSRVPRQFTVKLDISRADAAAKDTRLALTVCVAGWCFLDGPIGKTGTYAVTLGSASGEGVGQKWTIRVDRLTRATYDALVAQKDAAVANGTWGNGTGTPKERLNNTPVSAVTVTKAS